MNRDSIYFLPENGEPTFSRDDTLAKLPLPKLEDSLARYFRAIQPFGTKEELKNSEKVIKDFKNGTGKKLQLLLEQHEKNQRNWVERFWEDHAYHSVKMPLLPYCNMAQPLIVESVNVTESPENRLKAMSRCVHFCAKFWELIRQEKLRAPKNPDGSITFSSNLYKRLYNTVRIPGEIKDEIKEYFKTEKEGDCSSDIIVIGEGRVFVINSMDNGICLTPQQFLSAFKMITSEIENGPKKGGIPLLTCDDRSSWAKNRTYLKELSVNNAKFLEIVEASIVYVSLDNNEPLDYSECSLRTIDGDYNSRWCDKSSGLVSFKNGKFGCIGEHSGYDGTISISFSLFILMSLMEEEEPNWEEIPVKQIIANELKFQIDESLQSEIEKVERNVADVRNSILVHCGQFDGYGKTVMKEQKIHPDSYVQMALQLTYWKIHKTLAPTYETATMRVFYHGRTETVRSCSVEVVDWIKTMEDPKATKQEKAKLFRGAAGAQNRLMNEARKGEGFDRHLFGLWCIATESDIPIPEFYDDPLYSKSGGGGNFVLSTSTLGYSINVGFVAPMVMDGYGVFYSMLNDCVWIIITSYRDSEVTSSKRFYETFAESMEEIRGFLEGTFEAKL